MDMRDEWGHHDALSRHRGFRLGSEPVTRPALQNLERFRICGVYVRGDRILTAEGLVDILQHKLPSAGFTRKRDDA
jgi:hypothetical protein